MDLTKLERLAGHGFQIVPVAEIASHFVLERDGFVALVQRREDDFAQAGAPGLLTESGFAALVWRGPEPWFVARGFERPATDAEVESVRQFAADLRESLSE